MESGNPPTIEELEALQKKLVQLIEEAQLLYPDGNGQELLLGKAALKSVEQMIKRTQKKSKRDVA